MNKKGVIITAILVFATLFLLFGLSAMTDGMIDAQMGQSVTVTASPPPDYDALEQ